MKEKELHEGAVPFLKCKDHLVSNETYEVMINNRIDMLVTTPIPKNLGKYYDSKEYQSHNNSTHTLLNTLYNVVKNVSFKRKKALFHKGKTKKTVLDIGAGTGDFLLYCREQGLSIVGVEPNEKARKKAQEKGLKLEKSLNNITKKKYEIITLWHVLEHVPNLFEYIEQLKYLLSEKGQLFIAVPNFKSFDAEYYKEFWAAYDVPRHLWHFSQKSIHTLFEAVDMEVIKTHPMKYDAFYVSLLSEKNKKGKTNALRSFFIGLLSNIKASRSKEYSSLIYELKHAKTHFNKQ